MGEGEGVNGEGQGTFHPLCHILHYHMVLHAKGTSHNKTLHLVYKRNAHPTPNTQQAPLVPHSVRTRNNKAAETNRSTWQQPRPLPAVRTCFHPPTSGPITSAPADKDARFSGILHRLQMPVPDALRTHGRPLYLRLLRWSKFSHRVWVPRGLWCAGCVTRCVWVRVNTGVCASQQVLRRSGWRRVFCCVPMEFMASAWSPSDLCSDAPQGFSRNQAGGRTRDAFSGNQVRNRTRDAASGNQVRNRTRDATSGNQVRNRTRDAFSGNQARGRTRAPPLRAERWTFITCSMWV